MANFKIDRLKFRWTGNWTPATDYTKDDVVYYAGKAYVALESHTSSSAFYTDFGNTPRDLIVTVARNAEDTADVFFINGVERPALTLKKGRPYIFNQNDASNVSFSASQNPLYFSSIANGFYGGGSNYTKNVTYYLDNVEVSATGYVSGFSSASLREVRIEIKDDTPNTLYYWSQAATGYGNSIAASTTSTWELMFEGSAWRGTWQLNTLYNERDKVRYGGKIYECLTTHTSTILASLGLEVNQRFWREVTESEDWKNVWLTSTRYKVGDLVVYGGIVYRCNTGHTGASTVSGGLEVDIEKWDTVYDGTHFIGEWAQAIRYKVGDIVKYGSTLWVANTEHTSTGFAANLVNWTVYLEGLEFESIYDSSTYYQQGDVVWYGGYNYRAKQNNTNQNPVTASAYWQPVSERYKFDGDWAVGPAYEVGNVVRHKGYLYVAVADNTNEEPPNLSYWEVVSPSEAWRGLWITGISYKLGDLATYGSTTYVCKLAHTGSTLTRPDTDIAGLGTYWDVYVEGHSSNVLAAQGDILWYNSGSKDRFPKGSENELIKVSSGTTFDWDLFGNVSKVYYVATDGVDAAGRGTTLNEPWRTIKYACANVTGPATIFIKTGVYEEELPISIPASVALVGDELRSTIVQPAAGYESTDMFYVRNATGIRNMTLQGLFDTLSLPNEYFTKRPLSDVKFVSLDPGTGTGDSTVWITNKSPYIQNVTTFGTGCIGLKVDGSLHAGGNDSIVANDFTQVISGGIGCWITDLGRAELVSVFTYYCHIGYLATAGGKIRATNGNNSYGDYGSIAEGIDATETPITGSVNNRNFEAQIGYVFTDGDQILSLEYTNAGINYDSAAAYTFTGAGLNAAVSSANVVTNGIYEIRITDPYDSGTVGGTGYLIRQNYAQGGSGSSGTITLANSDESEESVYLGMKLVIISGAGVGQYGYISAYDPLTKIASISKESDDTSGWDHMLSGTPIVDPASTSRYQIEPRVIISVGTGTRATARVAIASGRIGSFRIINPGSGYLNQPTITVVDPNATSTGTWTARIGSGVLAQPTFSNRGTGYVTANATVTGVGLQDAFQTGSYIWVTGLTGQPGPGANIQFNGNPIVYRLVTIEDITGSLGNQSAKLRVSPRIDTYESPAHSSAITVRENYSQVRLTGHDFLDIGTGNFVETNYPGLPQNEPEAFRETNSAGGGRVFYTSTDQDGNFRVGELFKVEQATGIITLNADAFDLTGLTELRLGGVVLGGTGAVIREFSTDATLGANSNNIVPTQRALKTYIAAQIGGGGEDLNVSQLRAGQIIINNNQITSATGSIDFDAVARFTGGVDGSLLALAYFKR